ncbi:MAG TPA: acyltransferase [Coleofasciculaceae cyanobacterium]|jgi:peptidoglycan/LPS O-acetylase OafA/YrhL
MSKATRFVGIDLCRGLAAFAVILVHSGDETWGVPISDRAIQFRYLFYFAVPFFLAASFYFGTTKSPLKISAAFWQKKLQRIVMPYLLWSIFYLVSKTIIFSFTDNTDLVQQLLSDPLAIIFMGAASYHLYFIPLLLAGTILLNLANYLTKQRNSILWLFLLSIISLIIYQLLILSNNNFDLDSYTAFPELMKLLQPNNILYQLWRIILVNLAWIIRCAPYFLIALLINELLKQNNYKWFYKKQNMAILFVLFLLTNVAGEKYLPNALSELIIAYSLLLWGIAISQYISNNALIANLGLCSFGIYLIHPFVKSAVEIILIKLVPQISQSVSIASILTYSILSFIISWMFIYLMQKNKLVSQYL